MKRLASTLLAVAAALAPMVMSFDKAALGQWTLGLRADKVVWAINCGSNEDYRDLLGINYKAV